MMRLPGLKSEAPASSADFANSENRGLQMGQNYGTMEATFNAELIGGVNIAAGASVFMGENKTPEDKVLNALIANEPKDRCDIKRAEPGTCEWIFEHAAFREWMITEPPGLTPMYIHGTPGSGKSVILMFLAREIEKRMRVGTPSLSSPVDMPLSIDLGVPGKTIAAACFCDDKNEKRRQPIWILRTLLYKMFQQNKSLVKYAQKHLQNIEELDVVEADPDEFHSLDVLQKILEDMIPDPELEVVYFIIDGLDQCGPHLPAVVRLVKNLSSDINLKAIELGGKFRLRCIISDRGSKMVRDRMRPNFTIDMPRDNMTDIGGVTDKRLKGIQEYRDFPDTILKTTSAILRESSRGMFMWLSLVLEDLETWEGSWSEVRVKERLHSIPSDVAAFYKAMLERMPRDSAVRLRTLLIWVYFALRPLTLQELSAVLALQEEKEYKGGDSSEDDINALQRDIENNWSALFVIQDGAIHLGHQSVKDFLSHVFTDDGKKEYEGYGKSKTDAHRQMASTCLSYLQIEDVFKRAVPSPPVNGDGIIDEAQLTAVRKEYLKGFPFLRHAVENVGHYLRRSELQKENDVEGMKEFFSAESAALLSWVPAYDLLKRWTTGKYSGFSGSTSLLFVAARLDLPWLADRATTWKSYASLPVDVRIPDMSGWSAIHLAADSEAVAMIDWLLENGAMIDAETMGYPHPGRTALHFAASKRSDAGPQMVKTLLEKGKSKATVQTRQGGNTPLHYAIDGRSVETVQALLDSKADPNVTNGSGITPLHKAVAIPGLEEIVRVLLKGHADSNKKTSVGTISAARGLNSLRASRAWMKTYYEVNTSQSALHIAAKVKDTERTVEILLREGHANPNCRDSSGRTPLHVAVVRMDAEAVAKLLVEFKTDLNAQDMAGRTPLSTFMTAAAVQAETQPRLESELNGQASRERVLDLLLLHGSDPTIEGKDKRSPIIIATEAKLLWAVDRLTRKHQENGQDQVDKPEQKCEPSNGETGPKRGYLGRQASRWMPSRSKSST